MSSTSSPRTDTSLPVLPKKSVPKHKSRKRWLIGACAGVLIIIGAVVAYVLLGTQVTPLKLPMLPANLSDDQIGLAQWQEYQLPLPAHPLSNPSLPARPQVTPGLASLEDAAGQAFIKQGDLTRGLAYLKAAALAVPDNLRYSNDYRLALRDHQLYQDELAFFMALARKLQTPNTTIQYALAYVDLMRSCPKPPDGLVCQAQDSYSSIGILNGLLEKNPYNIVARYVRGLNHIYWPTQMRHLPNAQEDLQYAVALSRFQMKISPGFAPQAYIALGDVFGKAGDIKVARNVWLNGLNAVSTREQTPLQQRLAIPQDQLTSMENQQLRGLGVYVNTDLSLFWMKG
ncbi:hypothetical protein KSF_011220 [Reticulibacter mediterranei]|uniref:Tetratricopeptide repeat protein n=1 Tax=Reticulibacter mediterranei TaxID=2778369 RepID=A0A8J3MXK5_9CHLR|nr:hypothetical protein [Reticulibacter mediterranei]GHO91074.1 hypothetical protein KSF_011220 [Reticulibacter mediterranei]